MLTKIIVGFDFTSHSVRAIETAVDLARSAKASLVLVNVVPSLVEQSRAAVHARTDTSRGDPTTPSLERTMKSQVDELKAQHPDLEIDYGVEVEPNAAKALVHFATKWGGDLIVMGASGRKGVERILVGSVTAEVIQASPVPVLVVGPTAKRKPTA